MSAEEKLIDNGDGPINRQQINQCILDMQENHPLRSRAKFDNIFPCLSFLRICKKKKPDFRHALKQSFYEKMEIKMPKSDQHLLDDPFLILGYGVNAYFDILFSMVQMCLAITIFCIPLYYVYSGNDQHALKSEPKYTFNQFTLGNMGGSDIFCTSKRVASKKLSIDCPTGHILPDDAKFGMMSTQISQKVYCQESAMWAKEDKSYAKCTAQLDDTYIKSELKKCKDKQSCTISFYKSNGDISLYKSGANSTLTSSDGFCGTEAFFYVQVPCGIPTDRTTTRKIFGLFVGSIAVLIYLFTVIYFDYIKSVQVTKYVDWDVKTITAGDYTIEFDLETDQYLYWVKHYYDPTNPMSETAQFKLYVQLELEKRISAMDNLGFDDDMEEDAPMKIAQITFAYYNGKIINWLIKRGDLIKTEKWDDLKEKNDEIAEAIKSDQDLLDTCQRPCSVFATFESEEGYNRAINYNDEPQQLFLHDEIEIQEASEPTDIIWENRQFKPYQRRNKRLIVYFVIVLMLAVSACIIFVCSKSSNASKFKYPVVKCDTIKDEYKGLEKNAWLNDAMSEFVTNDEYTKAGKKTHYTGSMQCFCKNQQTLGDDFDGNYTAKLGNGTTVTQQMCKDYFNDVIYSKVLGQSIAFIIIAVNLVLKTVIIKLITWVGEDTNSEQLGSITNGVFYAQFFNTGLLLLIVNANMTEHSPKFITQYIKGRYYDYVPNWYSDVGQKLVQTMLINSIMPYVTVVTGFLIPKIKQMLDQKFKFDPYVTKKTSMAQYQILYSGAGYLVHFKYAGVLNIVYITMMYGIGMPLLFPIAAFNFFNQYVTEKIIVAYQVTLPPALDDKLTNNCIAMLKWAPILLLFNGYWMLSSPQIFQNKWSYKDSTEDLMKSQHFPTYEVNWASPVLMLCIASIILILIQKIFAHQLQKWGFALTAKDIQVDEDLPNFFKAIRLSQAERLIRENDNLKENFGITINDPDTVVALNEALDERCIPKKACQGTPWYNPLTNAKYKDLFHYIGASIDEREKIIEDHQTDVYDNDKNFIELCKRVRHEQSDMVVILLNLAYIPDEIVQNIDFKPEWHKRFKELSDKSQQDFNEQSKESNPENEGLMWKFQDADLEERYEKFMEKKHAENPEHQEAIKDFEKRKNEQK